MLMCVYEQSYGGSEVNVFPRKVERDLLAASVWRFHAAFDCSMIGMLLPLNQYKQEGVIMETS